MAFKLKRHRKLKKKDKLLKRLKELKAKKSLTPKEKVEMSTILALLKKKRTNKIESKKLNNDKQNEKISININITNDINTGTSGNNSDLMPGHIRSTTGSYRRGLIDNQKQ